MNNEKRVTEYMATLPPFAPANQKEWEAFATPRLELESFLFEKRDHEVAFAMRVARHLQVACRDKLARGEMLTLQELKDAGDAVDWLGRTRLGQEVAFAILMEHWEHWKCMPLHIKS